MTVLAGLFCERALQKMVKGSFGKGSFGNKIHVSKYTCILLPKEPLPKEPFTIFCRARSQKRALSCILLCYVQTAAVCCGVLQSVAVCCRYFLFQTKYMLCTFGLKKKISWPLWQQDLYAHIICQNTLFS